MHFYLNVKALSYNWKRAVLILQAFVLKTEDIHFAANGQKVAEFRAEVTLTGPSPLCVAQKPEASILYVYPAKLGK